MFCWHCLSPCGRAPLWARRAASPLSASQITFRAKAHKKLLGPSGKSKYKPWLRSRFLDYFDMKNRFLYSAFREPANIGELSVKFFTDHWREEEMSTMVADDFVVILFSVLFVFLM